jgi:arylsulfatase A-like enzyme
MPERKPDILLIVLDTLRRDHLSSYGHRHETSPALDAFAARATVFERAIAPAQWTIPAHASMFTGVYPSTHQLTQAHDRLSGSHPTLAEILRAGGYHTAGFCNNPLVGVLENDLRRGFTDFFNYAGAAPNRPLHIHRSGLRKALSRRWRRFAQAVSNQFARSDWLFRVSLHPLLTPVWTRSINYKGHTPNSIADASAYIDRHRAGREQGTDRQPLFLFMNLMGAHLPYRPPEDTLRRFAPHIARDRHAYRFMNGFNADAARWASPVDAPLSSHEREIIEAFYDAEIAYQDEHLGRLLRHLEESGALEDTLVIITADHGEGHGDHDFFGHSFVVYQELVHVPLLIHYPPAFPPGKRIRTNVSTRRIFHTVLDAAGIAPPLDETDPNADVTGLSLSRATNCRRDSENGLVFAEAFPPQTFLALMQHRQPELIAQLGLSQVRRGVYHDDHKLALVGDAVEALFDVEADPAETRNLAAEQQPLAAELRHKVDHFVRVAEHYRADGAAFDRVSDDVVDNLRALGYID